MERRPTASSSRIAIIACALSLSASRMLAAQAAGNAAPSLDASLAVSSDEGAEASARLVAAGAELRLWVGDCPRKALAGLAFPYVRLGATKPSGLAAFLYRPAAAGPQLIGASGTPLRLDSPETASWLGASLGEDFGLFAMAPSADTGRPAYGVWLAPRDRHGQALVAAAREPAREGGPAWYDTPLPVSTRLWSAVGANAGGKSWAIAGAGAAGTGFPGPDVAACRIEARASSGPFRADLEASAASPSWRAPDGREAPALRLDTELRWSARGLALTGGYRLVVDNLAEQDAATTTFRASAQAAGSLGQARASTAVSTGRAGEALAVELDSRIRLAFLPWLNLSSSWRAADGKAQRMDLSALAGFGDEVRFGFESGLRFVPEGRLVKGSCTAAVKLRGVVVEAGVRTDGWVEPGRMGPDSLGYTLVVVASLR